MIFLSNGKRFITVSFTIHRNHRCPRNLSATPVHTMTGWQGSSHFAVWLLFLKQCTQDDNVDAFQGLQYHTLWISLPMELCISNSYWKLSTSSSCSSWQQSSTQTAPVFEACNKGKFLYTKPSLTSILPCGDTVGSTAWAGCDGLMEDEATGCGAPLCVFGS